MKTNRQAKRRTSLIRGFSQFNPMVAGGQRNKCQKPCGIIIQSNYTKCEPEIVCDPKLQMSFYITSTGKLGVRTDCSGLSKSLYKSFKIYRITKAKLDSLGLTNDKFYSSTKGRTQINYSSVNYTDSCNFYCIYPEEVISDTVTSGIYPHKKYVWRVLLRYIDLDTGKTKSMYSDPVEVVYNDLL